MNTIAVHDFASAAEYLSGGRNKSDRPIENNTRVVRVNDDEIAIQLHHTYVVTYRRDGSVKLNSGGWFTVTTKERINAYLGIEDMRVWTERGAWYVYRFEPGEWERYPDHPEWDYQRTEHVKLCRFFDGIVVRGTEVLNPRPQSADEKQQLAEDNMQKRINRYIDGYLDAMEAGKVEIPGGGDCWLCAMKAVDGEHKGQTWGDATAHDHLTSHLKERYYVPTLLWNAAEERGYRDVRFVMSMRLDHEAWEDGHMKVRRRWNSTLPDTGTRTELRRELRRYLQRRLIPTRAGIGPSVPGQPTAGF